jgi:hypothetical protein
VEEGALADQGCPRARVGDERHRANLVGREAERCDRARHRRRVARVARQRADRAEADVSLQRDDEVALRPQLGDRGAGELGAGARDAADRQPQADRVARAEAVERVRRAVDLGLDQLAHVRGLREGGPGAAVGFGELALNGLGRPRPRLSRQPGRETADAAHDGRAKRRCEEYEGRPRESEGEHDGAPWAGPSAGAAKRVRPVGVLAGLGRSEPFERGADLGLDVDHRCTSVSALRSDACAVARVADTVPTSTPSASAIDR